MTIVDRSLVRLLALIRDEEDEDRLRCSQKIGSVLRDSLLRAYLVTEAHRCACR